MNKSLLLMCLLGLGSVAHAADYRSMRDLLADFVKLQKKADHPLDYWVDQLIELVKHKKNAQGFVQDLKRAHTCPKRLQQAFKKHAKVFDNAVIVYLMTIGQKKVKQAFEKRAKVKPKTTIAHLTSAEKAVVMTIVSQPAVEPVEAATEDAEQKELVAQEPNHSEENDIDALFQHIEENQQQVSYTPQPFNREQWLMLYELVHTANA